MKKPQRNTVQRQVILEELQKVKTHPTAVGVYDLVRRRLPNISLGTVYRNLELLSRQGVIQKLEYGSGEARFDGNPARHHHIRCVECNRVEDIHGPTLDVLGVVENDCSDYLVLGCHMEYFGLCPQCRDLGADSSNSRFVSQNQDEECPSC